MLRIRTLLLALAAFALVLGSALAAGVAFDASGFDPFEEDEGYVDVMFEDGVITFVFAVEEGHLPATMEGETLPLDDDFSEDLLNSDEALALYGGLPIGITPTTVSLDLEGDAPAIRDALMARFTELGLTMSECFQGGPICTFDVTHGEDHWLLSITPQAGHAIVYLQAMR